MVPLDKSNAAHPREFHAEATDMLALLGLLLIVIWIIGLFAHIAGGFIHLLLLVAAILIILHFLRGK